MLERWLHRSKIPAIHEHDIESIMRELGLYEKISAGELNCSICGSKIAIDTIQCIYMREGETELCCNSKSCYEHVLEEQRSI